MKRRFLSLAKQASHRLILGLVLALGAVLLAGCSTLGRDRVLGSLESGMSQDGVTAVWGEPTRVMEYEDSLGQHVRWLYDRDKVGEQGYWSMEVQQAGAGLTTTAVRRGRPYTQRYLAAWAVFTEGELVRWQTLEPPVEEPDWMKARRGLDHRSFGTSWY